MGWLKDPASSGDLLVHGLSPGEHYFACSVGDHCQRGMRLTVRVEAGTQPDSSQEMEVSLIHDCVTILHAE